MIDTQGAAYDETLRFLASPAALASLEADSYWPKWDSPWWRMALLCEMGLAREIPAGVVEALVRVVCAHYVTTFPFRIEDVPPGKDPVLDLSCHCQLGTLYQILAACGVDVDSRLPWIRPWFPRYQLPDGGLNCDEGAYTRPVPHSSIVSTLPALEAVLVAARRPLSRGEEEFLDRGAAYLIARKLWRSVSRGGAVIDEAWARPCFPRFYHYDLLRGLAFLTRWADERGRTLPREAVEEAVGTLERQQTGAGILAVGRRAFEGQKTLLRDADGTWTKGHAAGSFALLDVVSEVGVASPWLTREWASARQRLARVVR